MIKFSIIIPAYNCERFLERSVCSVARQEYPFKEILVLNDGSTDNSFAIAKRLETQFPCVKAFTHENMGVSATRNRGIDEATGDYIMFVDADDWMNDDALSNLAEHIHSDKNDIIYFDYVYIFNNKESRMTLPKFKKDKFYNDIDNLYLVHHIYDCINHDLNFVCLTVWTGCYSARYVKRANLMFDTTIVMNEDALFNLNALRQTKRIGYLSSSLYTYCRDNDSSATHSCPADIVEKHVNGINALSDFTKHYYSEDEYSNKMILSWAWFYICSITIMSAQHASFEQFIDNMHKTETSPLLSQPLKFHLPPDNNKYYPIYDIFFWAIKYKKYKLMYKVLRIFFCR